LNDKSQRMSGLALLHCSFPSSITTISSFLSMSSNPRMSTAKTLLGSVLLKPSWFATSLATYELCLTSGGARKIRRLPSFSGSLEDALVSLSMCRSATTRSKALEQRGRAAPNGPTESGSAFSKATVVVGGDVTMLTTRRTALLLREVTLSEVKIGMSSSCYDGSAVR